jgi:hypothetical protein
MSHRWEPLEAQNASWSHRVANPQQIDGPSGADLDALRAKREEQARTVFVAERSAARQEHNDQAKDTLPALNLACDGFGEPDT